MGRVEASPERGRPTTYALSARPAPARPMRKVQIIYYLCRNGQLEHPHFMELAQHPHQPLRLKGMHCGGVWSLQAACSLFFLSLLPADAASIFLLLRSRGCGVKMSWTG